MTNGKTLEELDLPEGSKVKFVKPYDGFEMYNKHIGKISTVNPSGGTYVDDEGNQGWGKGCGHLFVECTEVKVGDKVKSDVWGLTGNIFTVCSVSPTSINATCDAENDGFAWYLGDCQYELVEEAVEAKSEVDYNDGEWHVWSGGECPVHTESRVDIVFVDGSKHFDTDTNWNWFHDICFKIVSFRVVKPYVEPVKPREFWLYRDEGNPFEVKESKPFCSWDEVIHVREVVEGV